MQREYEGGPWDQAKGAVSAFLNTTINSFGDDVRADFPGPQTRNGRLGAISGTVLGVAATFLNPGSKATATAKSTQIAAAWSASVYRHDGLMTAIEHIMYRRGSGSGFENVSKFAAGTGAKDIKSLIDSTLRNGTVSASGKNAFTIEYNTGRVIGAAAEGSDVSKLIVHVRDGNIQTAFPF